MNTEEIKRTSAEWQLLKPETIVLDSDGWDRKNYEYSWGQEMITESEYNNRLFRSTSITGYKAKMEFDKIPIKRGCSNRQCFCTGKCNEIIGYRDAHPLERFHG
jgi:hypothetical protein